MSKAIEKKESEEIDKSIKKPSVLAIKNRYDKDSKVNFYCLDEKIQTVIASVSFQYGSNLSKRTPLFWNSVVNQNWNETIDILNDFGDRYPTRRKKEANYLKGIID